jgi:hypothetical protein
MGLAYFGGISSDQSLRHSSGNEPVGADLGHWRNLGCRATNEAFAEAWKLGDGDTTLDNGDVVRARKCDDGLAGYAVEKAVRSRCVKCTVRDENCSPPCIQPPSPPNRASGIGTALALSSVFGRVDAT